jgi:predicted amidophosphoribosyltransferase
MTAYDSFRRRNTALQISGFIAFVLFCISATLFRNLDLWYSGALLFTSWMALLVCGVMLYAGNRCPRCEAKMRDIPISCPKCGLNLTSVEHDRRTI